MAVLLILIWTTGFFFQSIRYNLHDTCHTILLILIRAIQTRKTLKPNLINVPLINKE